MRVGTLPWLLRHEWRVWCRHPSGLPFLISTSKKFLGILLIYGIALSVVGFFKDDLSYPLQYLLQNLPQNSDAALWMAVVIWFWMFYFSFLESSKHLDAFLRQPQGLTFFASSPLSPQPLFITIFVKVAGAALLSKAPLFLCCSFLYWPSLQLLVGVVITNILLTVQCTSLVMGVFLCIARWWGVRRAVVVTTFSSALFVLVWFCYLFVMPESNGEMQSLWQLWQQHTGERLWWGRASWLWFPARTVLLDPGAIFAMTLFSGGSAWISCQFLPTIFVDVIQQPQIIKQLSSSGYQQAFISGVVRSVMLKEWRLLSRSTRFRLIAACLNGAVILEILIFPYLPISSLTPHLLALCGLLVLWMAVLTTRLLIRMSCVDRQDLTWLGSAPVLSLKLSLSKVSIALLMVWGMCAPMVGAIAFSNGPTLLLTLLLFPMTITQAVLSMWHVDALVMPQNLSTLDWRAQNDTFSYLEVANTLSWLGLAVCIYLQYWAYGGAIATLLMGIMAIASWHRHRLRVELFYTFPPELGS